MLTTQKDFQDLENFKAIDENADVEGNSYGLVENQQDYHSAMNMMNDQENSENYNTGKYPQLKTRTDFISSKNYENNGTGSDPRNFNGNQQGDFDPNLIAKNSLPPVNRDNMKTRSTKYKADLIERLAKIQRSRDNPKISKLLNKLIDSENNV